MPTVTPQATAQDPRRSIDPVRAAEDRFFATSIDMLCFLDFDGYFARLNPAWERTLGFTIEELKSRPFIEFVHPDDRERTLAQNARVRAGQQATGFENRYVCRDGTYRWLHWNAAPDALAGVIYSVARDVTAKKQAEEERDQMLAELRAALAEVNELRRILPICSYCRKVRDDENYWHTVEAYISHHTSTRFSHGVCPGCMSTQVEPQLVALETAEPTRVDEPEEAIPMRQQNPWLRRLKTLALAEIVMWSAFVLLALIVMGVVAVAR